MYWSFKNNVTLELELSSKTVITALTENPECGQEAHTTCNSSSKGSDLQGHPHVKYVLIHTHTEIKIL